MEDIEQLKAEIAELESRIKALNVIIANKDWEIDTRNLRLARSNKVIGLLQEIIKDLCEGK